MMLAEKLFMLGVNVLEGVLFISVFISESSIHGGSKALSTKFMFSKFRDFS